MRSFAVVTSIAVALTLVACGSSSPDVPPPAPPAPPAPPPYVMPDVAGMDTLEDTNPDPNIVEVTLTAGRAKASLMAGWMAHCHILEHAEMGMMGEVMVTPDPNAPPMAPMSH